MKNAARTLEIDEISNHFMHISRMSYLEWMHKQLYQSIGH